MNPCSVWKIKEYAGLHKCDRVNDHGFDPTQLVDYLRIHGIFLKSGNSLQVKESNPLWQENQ